METYSLLCLPEEFLSGVIWEAFHIMKLRDWLKLQLVCSSFAEEMDRLIHTRDPFHNDYMEDDGCWKPSQAEDKMTVPQSARYQTENAMLRKRSLRDLDRVAWRVAEQLLPLVNNRAIKDGETPTIEFKEVLYSVYECWMKGRKQRQRASDFKYHSSAYPVRPGSFKSAFITCATYLNLKEPLREAVRDARVLKTLCNCHFGHPIQAAAQAGNLELVQLYTDHCREEWDANYELHAASDAGFYGHWPIVKLLWGSDLHFHSNWWLHLKLKSLQRAVMGGQLHIVRLGLDIARVKVSDTDPRDSLHPYLLNAAVRSGQTEIFQYLVDEGAKPKHEDGNTQKNNFLLIAAECGHTGLIPQLTGYLNGDYMTYIFDMAIRRAAAHGYVDTVKALLDHGVEIDGRDKYVTSWLGWVQSAAARGEIRVINLLLDRVIGGQSRYSTCIEAAKVAAQNGYVTAAKMLLSASKQDIEPVKAVARVCQQWHVVKALEDLEAGYGVEMPWSEMSAARESSSPSSNAEPLPFQFKLPILTRSEKLGEDGARSLQQRRSSARKSTLQARRALHDRTGPGSRRSYKNTLEVPETWKPELQVSFNFENPGRWLIDLNMRIGSPPI